MEPSSCADWAAALAGFLAFGAVIWQQCVETKRRKADIDRERRNRQEEDANRQAKENRVQADTIAAWIVPRPYEAAPGQFSNKFIVDVQNGSTTPVYTVVVTLVPIKGAAPRRSEDLTPADRLTKLLMAMPPRTFWVEFPRPPMAMGMEYGVEIAFRDTAGRSWVRRVDGNLESLGGADPREGRLSDFSAKSDEFFESWKL